MALTQPSGLSAAQKRKLKQNEPTMDDVTGIPEAVATEADLSTMIEELASTDSGKGASCIGYEGGTTVQAQVAANTASLAALGGGGSTGFDAETAGAGGLMDLYEATANGTNKVRMQAPASLAADRAITVPDADVTLADIATNTAAIAAATTDTGVGAGNAGKLVELDGGGLLDGRNIGDDGTKLDGIEALADVTDETNVLAALAVGATAKDMGGGAISNVGLVDGRDVSTDGTKLDGIEALADVTDLANVTTALSVTAATAVATSAGAGDAGKLAKLDAGGLWDSTMIPAGGDSTALHDNVSGEIAAVAEKNPAIAADLLLIEDSADTNAKKRVQAQNLPVAVAGVSAGLLSAADKTKLDGVEALADVTDLANVSSALGVAAAVAVTTTTGGAGNDGKAIKLDAAGKIDGYSATDWGQIAANAAEVAASAATTIGLTRHILVEIANGVTRDIDTPLPPGTWEPIDAWVVNEEASVAADSIQLVAQGVGAITEDMSSLAADQAVLRPTTFNRTQLVGGTNALRCAVTAAAGAAPAQTAHFLLRQVA